MKALIVISFVLALLGGWAEGASAAEEELAALEEELAECKRDDLEWDWDCYPRMQAIIRCLDLDSDTTSNCRDIHPVNWSWKFKHYAVSPFSPLHMRKPEISAWIEKNKEAYHEAFELYRRRVTPEARERREKEERDTRAPYALLCFDFAKEGSRGWAHCWQVEGEKRSYFGFFIVHKEVYTKGRSPIYLLTDGGGENYVMCPSGDPLVTFRECGGERLERRKW